MSNIDKHALREAAEKAQAARARLESIPDEDVVLFEENDIKSDVSVCNKFIVTANPSTVLALLDELEVAEKRVAELEAREVKLPELCVGVVQGGHAVMVPYAAGHWFNKTAILEMLANAGINIAAAGKGE